MRTSFLPNLRGLINNGAQLKIQLTKSLNHAMMYAKRGPGYSPAATALYTFLVAAINANRTYTRANSIAVTPTAQALANAATAQIAVTGTYPDGVTEAVSASDGRVTYTTSDATKATVSKTGLITKVAAGSATITTTYQGRTATTNIT
jgi:uncharacterized protein YjdB